jgi:lipopolysaccharide/colanic/teichoic acid biosynthesis glycosyltransferase
LFDRQKWEIVTDTKSAFRGFCKVNQRPQCGSPVMQNWKFDIAERADKTGAEPGLGLGMAAVTSAERLLILAATNPRQPGERRRGEFAGRAIDVAVALALIAFLLPLLVLLAVAIAIFDPGPVFFAHRRVGRDGRPFDCYKFRTMRVDAEAEIARLLERSPALRAEWALGHKLVDDPRVSDLGRLLRATSLDELPQLFNVLAGDMSLVGPRPVTADELSRYRRHVSSYLGVRPGLTGLWQVSRCRHTTYRRRVATDVLYVRRKSLALDCKILLATIPAVLLGKASY